MNNEEPVQSAEQNVQLSTTGVPLPEQTRVCYTNMPRQVSILSWINQWQPMGIRVVLNLPFTGNDQDFLFAIRNGPFIPTWDLDYSDNNPEGQSPQNPWFGDLISYGWNNMRNVILPASKSYQYPDKPSVYLTQYDYPPPLSTLAQCFRRWRGDIQYRIRVVAGFVTQGYVIATTLKNVFSPIGIYDEYKTSPILQRQDLSYRAGMINSYVPSDTSMIRHLELTMQYEYPTPYYDQYAWISRRISPRTLFRKSDGGGLTHALEINSEPHGDNWIVLGVRGNLAAGQEGAQIGFELEYRAVEGFQFADPGLPPRTIARPYSSIDASKGPIIKRIPDKSYTSDGLGWPVKATAVVQEIERTTEKARAWTQTTTPRSTTTLGSTIRGARLIDRLRTNIRGTTLGQSSRNN